MALAGLRLAREILRQPALKPFILAERQPGPASVTDEALLDYAYKSCKTDHHPIGTCAMGSDAAAVVGPDLKLRGIEGLRVCDSAALPAIPSSNTNAPVIMLAEKAADHIRGGPLLAPACSRR
jgi:Choline dehydrogenase and related flavoproteins